jgi:hypothetical protein
LPEDLALDILRRAVEISRQNPHGPDEASLMRQESAFSESLCARGEFQRLLNLSPGDQR